MQSHGSVALPFPAREELGLACSCRNARHRSLATMLANGCSWDAAWDGPLQFDIKGLAAVTGALLQLLANPSWLPPGHGGALEWPSPTYQQFALVPATAARTHLLHAPTNPSFSQQQGGALEHQQQWHVIAAGALARTLAQVAVHPIDTLKTRLMVSPTASTPQQLLKWQKSLAASQRQVSLMGVQLKLANPLQAKGGFFSLYRGVTGAALTALPTALLFFATDAACKAWIKQQDHAHTTARSPEASGRLLGHLLSSGTAALVSALVRVPGDVCKHRVQAFLHDTVLDAARSAWRKGGLKGVYCGFNATLLRDVPEMALQFTLYELLRNAYTQQSGGDAGSAATALGAVAGALASAVTTPLDVIKCQMQCQGQCNAAKAVSSILKHRGVGGFISGLAPRVAQQTLVSAVFFSLYECFKAQIAHHQQAPHAAGLDTPSTAHEVAQGSVVRLVLGSTRHSGPPVSLLSAAQPLQLA